MTAPDEGRVPPIDDNPFPAQAAAEVQNPAEDVVSVETPAIERAAALLDGYFRRRDDKGVAFLVTGEHGSGKTHLLFELLRRTMRHSREGAGNGGNAEYAYVDAQKGDFLSLYRNSFLHQFDRDDMVDRVRAYYANIVADSLEDTGFPADVTGRLRSADIDPQRFVAQFNLAESTFLARLNEDLSEYTRNEEFGTALVLLLRPDLRDAVWEWLCGQRPSPLLVERGIASHIDDEVAALEAMGVITLLYRGRARHFVLAFDQLDKVLPSSSPPRPGTVTALQRLIDLMAAQGVCLVLSGLQELRGAVGAHAHEHSLSADIRTGGMSADEVRAYVRAAVATTRGGTGLGPFPDAVVDYIAHLAGHSARKVVQICHTCYRQARDSGQVTAAMVERAARGPAVDAAVVRDRIEQELHKQAREYHTNHPVDGVDGPRAPYWVPAADTGCALFLSGPLILADDTARVVADAEAVRAAAPGCRTALIVNGFVSDPARAELEGRFTEPFLVFAAERFADDFSWLVRRMTEQLEASVSGGEQLRMVRASVSRLATAQGSTQNFLEMLAFQVESMRSASERQFADLARRLQDLGRAAPAAPLPDDAERLFGEVLTALRRLTGLDSALAEMFSEEPSGVATGLLLRLQNHGVVRAVGVAALAEAVVVAFRDAVRAWHRGLDGPPTAGQRGDLNALCRNYETVLDYLPIQLLGTLAGRVADPPSRGPVAGHGAPGLPQADLYALLTDLGFRIRRSLASGGPHG